MENWPCWGTDSKVGHVRDEDCSLDHLGNGRARRLNNSLDILASLAGLLGDTLDHLTLGGKRNLARAIDHVGGLDGLRLVWHIMSVGLVSEG